jgi:hypothetical protein
LLPALHTATILSSVIFTFCFSVFLSPWVIPV